MTATAAATVALIGANGHGRKHRKHLAALQAAGTVRLAGLADVRPVDAEPGVAVFTDHRELLAATHPDVVVICTPPHTHLPIALDALDAGCDVLLEKPPVPTVADHRRLLAAVRSTGRACQVGFQALGSTAAARFEEAVAGIGLTDVAAVGSWQRDDAYYTRAPWAGRRSLDGRPVVDGALVNSFAHALMQALAATRAGTPRLIEVERYRTRGIEVDDTTFARLTFDGGLRITAAVTLAGEDFIPGEIIANGTAGRTVLEYPTDRLALPGDASPRTVPGRVDLLENLLAHRAEGAALVAPLERTASFTAVLEALTGLPVPPLLGEPHVETRAGVRTIRGINGVLRRAAAEVALPSELGVTWAVPPLSLRPLG
jgi:predicted dehydrogenase